MTKTRSLAAETDTARRLFFEKGRNPAGWVPDLISRSWQRCTLQLDCAQMPAPGRIDSQLLSQRREEQGRLRRIVQPEMDALAELVSDSDSLVLLADGEGLILDAVGGLGFLRKAERVSLQPGVVWSERGRGTNAIGTALVERRPVAVRGRQHYLEANGILSCAAAPILSPQGELMAVLDVSGDSEHLNSQALGMVRMAVQTIEHRLIKDLDERSQLLRFHANSDLLGSHREGILILEEARITGANRTALNLLGADWQELLDTSAEDWLQLPASRGGEWSRILEDHRGQRFHAVMDGQRSLQVPVGVNPTHETQQGYLDAETAPLLEKAARVLDAGISVLITGETGAGKEVFARRLHEASQRGDGPFVAVNCAALPESLIESELFGYEAGAFTGARRTGMPGRVREADGGVLFLDEIGDMPLALQARLLRVLQDREVMPLGGGQPVGVDFALVCATNRELSELVREGGFRADLFYRIQDFTLRLPALRECAGCRRIITDLLASLGGGELGLSLSEQALDAMVRYHWPGNLRQLTSVLRTLIALADRHEVIGIDQLPPEIGSAEQDYAETGTAGDLASFTQEAIEQALRGCDGNVSEAARRLGIHRSTIYRWQARRG